MLFRSLSFLYIAPPETDYCKNIYWVFGITVDNSAPFSRGDLMEYLTQLQIGTRTFFYGLHEQPALRNAYKSDLPSLVNTERLSKCGFYLPSGLGLTDENQSRVIESVLEFIEKRAS